MQLRHWKTQWIPLQIYVLIVDLKVKELLTACLRKDIKSHLENIEKVVVFPEKEKTCHNSRK